MTAERLVYSTSQGRLCPACTHPIAACTCSAADVIPDSDGIVRVSLDGKGRRGKHVTVIAGIPLAPKDLKALAKQLKARCGTGGTAKGGVIEIQGDHRDALTQALRKQGYTVKQPGR